MSLSMNKLNKKARLWDFLILMVLGFPRLPGPPAAFQVYPGIKGLSGSGHPRPSGTGGGFRTKPLTIKTDPWARVLLVSRFSYCSLARSFQAVGPPEITFLFQCFLT